MLTLRWLEGKFAVAQLPADANAPEWWDGKGFACICRTDKELTIVCAAERIPPGTTADFGWVGLGLEGSVSFEEPGIILSLIRPLSENGLGVFVLSTFSGDGLLLKEEHVDKAYRYLQAAGHRFV